MNQNLIISGKKYISSIEAAGRFGYTSDYISRLAREEKIEAIHIHRKWFIDFKSLCEFKKLSSLEKKMRSEVLKKQRKAERVFYQHAIKTSEHTLHKTDALTHIAIAQSVAVFMCVAFVGLLGWTVEGSNLTMQHVTGGAQNIYDQLAQAVIPNADSFKGVALWSVASVYQQSQPFVEEVPLASGYASTGNNIKNKHTNAREYPSQFSDEVHVLFETDGIGVVRPVFKNRLDDTQYRIVIDSSEDGG